MDYDKESFFRMQQFDTPKVPFYMSYPMQNLYLTEMEYEKDMDRMKELYPKDVKRILEAVEEECDKMEYEGSLMFDEYPDRLMIEMVTDRIYENVRDGGDMAATEQTEFENVQNIRTMQEPGRGGRPSGHRPPGHGPDDALRSLIHVILNNEMYRRRCRHRRCRRWW